MSEGEKVQLHDWDQDGFGYFCKRCFTRSRLGPGGAVADEPCLGNPAPVQESTKKE